MSETMLTLVGLHQAFRVRCVIALHLVRKKTWRTCDEARNFWGVSWNSTVVRVDYSIWCAADRNKSSSFSTNCNLNRWSTAIDGWSYVGRRRDIYFASCFKTVWRLDLKLCKYLARVGLGKHLPWTNEFPNKKAMIESLTVNIWWPMQHDGGKHW